MSISEKKVKNKKNEVIVLFSGGKDSFLTVCLLIERGYKVHMVNFKTLSSVGDRNVLNGVERIIKKYGKEKIDFLGIFSVVGIHREFFLPFLNMKQSEILRKYGDITYSQFNCLTCRSAMYVWTVLKAQEMGIFYVADGARKIQGFVIELPIMVNAFKKFFKEFSIKLLCPVLNIKSDWYLKNSLLSKGFLFKTSESQCLLGVPLLRGKIPDKDIQKATLSYFNRTVLPRTRQLIRSKFSINAKEKYL